MKKICLVIFLLTFMVMPASAQNFSYIKEVPCPETRTPLQAGNAQGYELYKNYFKPGEKDYIFVCYYEDNSQLVTFWSENFEDKINVCSEFTDEHPQTYEFIGQAQMYLTGIGVNITKQDQSSDYALAFNSAPGSPAEAAGIIKDDQIMQIDNIPLKGKDINQILDVLDQKKKGEQVRLNIFRPSENKHLEVTVNVDTYMSPNIAMMVISPTHSAMSSFSFDTKLETFDEDLKYWQDKSIELIHTVEELAVKCRADEVLEKGPPAL